MSEMFKGIARKLSLIIFIVIFVIGLYFTSAGITGYTTYETQIQSTTATVFGIILVLISLICLALYLKSLE